MKGDKMPRNKKEGIIFGTVICFIMVFFMGLLNISIHMGRLDLTSFLICIKAFSLNILIAGPISRFVLVQIQK